MRQRYLKISCMIFSLWMVSVMLCVPTISHGLNLNGSIKAEEAKNLIVIVMGEKNLGAGIIFNKRGEKLFIATANHVVERGVEWVEFRFLRGIQIAAKLVKSSKPLDLAILRIDLKEELQRNQVRDSLSFRQVGYSTQLKSQDIVYPVGHPGGVNWYVPTAPPKIYKIVEEEITVDYKCSPGQSGGGLFNDHWDLVGMIRKTNLLTSEALSFKRISKSLESWNLEVSLRLNDILVTGEPPPPHVIYSSPSNRPRVTGGISERDSKALLHYLRE